MSKYSLTVECESGMSGDICIFQEAPNTNASNVLTLAWLSKRVHPGTSVTFNWDVDYCFVWGETKKLGNGSSFHASQCIEANLKTRNDIDFVKIDGAYKFEGGVTQRPGASEGSLYIDQGGSVLSGESLVGVGMSGNGTFVVDAQPNIDLIFKPNPTYYVVFGDYVQGQVMDITQLSNIHKVKYNGVQSKSLHLDASNTWSEV